MHCELLLPALYAGAAALREAAPGLRLPALELLLARGRRSEAEPQSAEMWLADAFEVDAQALPAGALTALADGEVRDGALWLRADPVHVQIGGSRHAILPAAAAGGVTQAQAQAFIDTLNRHFTPELEFHAFHPERWCARLAEGVAPPEADAPPGQPASEAARRWRVRLNETQMLLHEHPANAARAAPINSLRFWGAGRLPAEAQARFRSLSAEEPLARGLARLAGIPARALPGDAQAWLAGATGGVHLAAFEDLRMHGDAPALAARMQELETRWFAPLLAALREGRIGMLSLHAPDGAQALSCEAIRGDLRRFWRRVRALEHRLAAPA